MAPNIPEMYEAHFGVPMTGGVLNSLNTRLDAAMIAFILDHSETKVLLVDREFHRVVTEALAIAKVQPLVVDIDDPLCEDRAQIGDTTYEEFLTTGDPDYAWDYPADEWNAISLNYTSGTTGNPKGVVYSHRGATLSAYGNATQWPIGLHPVYLWTLPMFHCNGWCFPWTLALVAGTSVCLRRVSAKAIYDALVDHDVTHMCGAPIIMQFIIGATPAERRRCPPGRVHDRRRAAARRRAGGAGEGEFPRHPRLWADRGLRSGDDLLLARGMGRAARARARTAQGAPGRALCRRGRRHGDGSDNDEGSAARRHAPWAR